MTLPRQDGRLPEKQPAIAFGGTPRLGPLWVVPRSLETPPSLVPTCVEAQNALPSAFRMDVAYGSARWHGRTESDDRQEAGIDTRQRDVHVKVRAV
jgi:hypothetical protein